MLARVRAVAPNGVANWFTEEGPAADRRACATATTRALGDPLGRCGRRGSRARSSRRRRSRSGGTVAVAGFLVIAAVIAVLLPLYRGTGRRARRSGPARWALGWVPGLRWIQEGHGWRAYFAVLVPVSVLLLPRLTTLGYRLPWGFDPGTRDDLGAGRAVPSLLCPAAVDAGAIGGDRCGLAGTSPTAASIACSCCSRARNASGTLSVEADDVLARALPQRRDRRRRRAEGIAHPRPRADPGRRRTPQSRPDRGHRSERARRQRDRPPARERPGAARHPRRLRAAAHLPAAAAAAGVEVGRLSVLRRRGGVQPRPAPALGRGGAGAGLRGGSSVAGRHHPAAGR